MSTKPAAMRYPAAIIVLTAATVWADERPFTWEPARTVRVEEAVSSGVLAPADPHPVFFDFFSDAILENDGSVVFVANSANQGISKIGREGVYVIDREGRPSAFVQKGDALDKSQSAVAAITALEMRSGAPVARCVLENGSEEEIVLGNVASDRQIFATSTQYRARHVTNGGRSIHRTGRNGAQQLVVDLSTRIAGLFAGAFTNFDERVVEFGSWVVFSGSAGAYEGLFAMNMETNRLYVLLDNRSLVGDRHVEDFRISESPRSGADIAVTVSFTAGTSGIYIFRFADSEGKLLFGGVN